MDYLDECEAICETALARQSGPWEGLIDEKIRGSEISNDAYELLIFYFATKILQIWNIPHFLLNLE
jgi:hypothetical protein